jgi:hypothetical protein
MQNMNKNSINGHIKAHLDYEFLFDCVAKGFALMKMPGLPKLCSMTDAAPSICKDFSISLLKESLLYRLVYWFHVKNDAIDSTHFVHVTQATATAKGGRPRLEPEVN